ncbi:MAG: methyltransferase domain-containing protein [bacterium]|nr:methyltransferase domain-containing protein [bacterium]
MGYQERKISLLDPTAKLEELYIFKDFPVFMGCVDEPLKNDLVADEIWDICTNTGIIQLRKLIPLPVLYPIQHADGVGKVWQDHYAAFARFLLRFKPKKILEIGGAHDYIARNVWGSDESIRWITLEPNPVFITNSRIRVIKGWFNEEFTLDEKVDTVVHSHVLEHAYDPFAFIRHVGAFLEIGDRHVFTFPNMRAMLKSKFTNCLNFEHTVFLTEEIVEYMLANAGFSVIAKEYYGDPHSIFYATEKVEMSTEAFALPSQYVENKELFTEYISYHLNMIRELNNLINASTEPVYLFGAHIFSQTLIQFGLNLEKIASILDNSILKQHKRLYGTAFMVESPKILKNKGRVNVILKAGIYNDEIKKDILENINDQVVFW